MKTFLYIIFFGQLLLACDIQVDRTPCLEICNPNIFTSADEVYKSNLERIPEDVYLCGREIQDTFVTIQANFDTYQMQSWAFRLNKNDLDSFLRQNNNFVFLDKKKQILLNKNNGLLFCFITSNNLVMSFHGDAITPHDDSIYFTIYSENIIDENISFRGKIPLQYSYHPSPIEERRSFSWNVKMKAKNVGVFFKSVWYRCFNAVDQSPSYTVFYPNLFTSVKGLGLPDDYKLDYYTAKKGDTTITFTLKKYPYEQVISQKWEYTLNNDEYKSFSKRYYIKDSLIHDFQIIVKREDYTISGLPFLFHAEQLPGGYHVIIEYIFPDRKYLEGKVPFLK